MYYIADEARLRKTANVFVVAKSTTSKVIRRLANTISTNLSADYIKAPTTEEDVKHYVSRFCEAHGFPQCIGCVDGTHIQACQLSRIRRDTQANAPISSMSCSCHALPHFEEKKFCCQLLHYFLLKIIKITTI